LIFNHLHQKGALMRKRGKTKELSMNHIREVARLLYQCHQSQRKIAQSCHLARSSVQKYLWLIQNSGLSYDQIQLMNDADLRAKLKTVKSSSKKERPLPQWCDIHQDFKKKGVTLRLLWEEYKIQHPDGYQLSQFCLHYQQWTKRLKLSMRQVHKAGEKFFVDYAGQTISILDPKTGRIAFEAQIFIATLGASNYTYAEATASQKIEDWLMSHVRAFEFIGGVPDVIVPDNLKSGVTKPCYYEPEINKSYLDLAQHYGTTILPARVAKPRDKAKVENAVLVVGRWILAALRKHTFFSLHDLNKAIHVLLQKLNDRPFQKLPGTRRIQYESLDKPELKPLPAQGYVFAQWKQARVNIDYHIEFKKHYYSVPYSLVQKSVDIRATSMTIEVFRNHKRVTSHHRCDKPGGYTTQSEHMPKSHQNASWSPEKLLRWAHTVGPATEGLCELILSRLKHPQQGYRSCLGILRLSKSYDTKRIESACHRAIEIKGYSYKSVQSILKNGLDRESIPSALNTIMSHHENVRGKDYFVNTQCSPQETNHASHTNN
jgi:transposase